jgi:hypothetical protein
MQNIQPKNFNELIKDLTPIVHEYPEIFHHIFSNEGNQKKSIKAGLESLIDTLNSGAGPSTFNFYPSKRRVGCHEFCLGIATKKFGHNRDRVSNRTGFKGLIKELISYWLSCGSINKTTIIITTDWDDQDFEDDWINILDSYVKKDKRVEIYQVLERQNAYLLKYPL